MKGLRVLLAGLAGGAIMFAWGAVSHMVLPLGDVGVKQLPQEEALVGAMKGAITEPGFYRFPAMEGDSAHHPTPEQQKAWEAKYAAGPRGVLIIDPAGGTAMDVKQLGSEFATGTVAALLAAVILRCLSCGFIGRLFACTMFGVVGWLSIDASYHIWDSFPKDFAVGRLIEGTAGWFLAGLAIVPIAGRCGGSACCAKAAT